MKTIDILNIIANDEKNKFIKEVYDFESIRKMFGVENLKEFLNKEVAEIEIVEDKKIKNIGIIYFSETPTEAILHRKIEEIIDYINKNEEKK